MLCTSRNVDQNEKYKYENTKIKELKYETKIVSYLKMDVEILTLLVQINETARLFEGGTY